MNFKGENILSSDQFSRRDLDRLFSVTSEMLPFADKKERSNLLEDKILATLFFEPSTRTRFSFETAMLRLGGRVISNHTMEATSCITKGETLYDTGKVMSTFADIIVMRHPESGSVEKLALGATIPVINGGDGASDHPTQGLLDLYTIQKNVKNSDSFTIVIVGDLKNSRVAHAQCRLLKNYRDVKFVFVSLKALKMPSEIVSELKEKGFSVTETEDFLGALPVCDVLSVTRVQKERFSSEEEYKKFKGTYVLTPELLKKLKSDAIVISPLPRVDEIHQDCDKDSRCKYFEQVKHGVALRMALLALVLGLK